jgi:CysZ protein
MSVLRGIGAFLGGVRFVLQTRAVWWRAAIPALMALALTAGLALAGIHFALPWAHRLFGDGLAEEVFAVALVALVIVVAFMLALALARPLSGWALDGVVREQQRALAAPGGPLPLAPAGASGHVSMGQSVAASLLALAAGVPPLVGLTAIGWLFPPAAIVTAPLGGVIAALLLAWDLLEYPLSIQGMPPAERARWCLRNFGSVLGFGLAAAAFFAIPVVGWLAFPFGVAGATRLAMRERRGTSP